MTADDYSARSEDCVARATRLQAEGAIELVSGLMDTCKALGEEHHIAARWPLGTHFARTAVVAFYDQWTALDACHRQVRMAVALGDHRAAQAAAVRCARIEAEHQQFVQTPGMAAARRASAYERVRAAAPRQVPTPALSNPLQLATFDPRGWVAPQPVGRGAAQPSTPPLPAHMNGPTTFTSALNSFMAQVQRDQATIFNGTREEREEVMRRSERKLALMESMSASDRQHQHTMDISRQSRAAQDKVYAREQADTMSRWAWEAAQQGNAAQAKHYESQAQEWQQQAQTR